MRKNIILLLFCTMIFIPNKSWSQKDTISIGAYINSLYDFNLTDNSYKTEFWLWMKYDKNAELDSLPNQIEFINAKSAPQIEAASTNSRGKVNWFGAKYIAEFQKNWDVTSFPFDKQKLKISIESGEYSSDKIVFKCDYKNSKLNQDIKDNINEWNVIQSKFYIDESHYNTTFGDPDLKTKSSYPSFNFEVYLARKDPYLVLFKLITGLLVAFIISCCVFFIKPTNTDPRFGLSVGGLFAAIGNKYIIESKVPATNQITLLDNIHNLTFVYILIITILSVVSLHIFEKNTKSRKEMSRRLDRVAFITIFLSYFTILFCIIW
ncbi:hypothetical protein [Flavobacterium sp. XGLA_31]|uniref:hypothetical protein n=1 Tax=Flavobacterium sp. XGLA_31 TaxID=3447666 RepID=UPI003F2FA741